MIKLGILAADAIFKDDSIRRQLADGYDPVDIADWKTMDGGKLLSAIRSCEVVIMGRKSPKLPAALAADFGLLRYACYMHGSIRPCVDKPLIEAGLCVTNWGDSQSHVAEGAMALLLCQLKQLVPLNAWTRGQAPDERIFQAYECTLRGRDVGIYGFSTIGRHMAALLRPFGAKLASYDPYATGVPSDIRRCSTLRDLFATCQIITIHCGLNDQTRHSVNRELLCLLPQGGIVVNTARGDIVDEEALGDLVAAGKLLAGLDVVHDEDNWPGSCLAKASGAVLTRHCVGGGKGYPPGAEPPPSLPDYVVFNLRAWRMRQPLVNAVTAEEYDLKT